MGRIYLAILVALLFLLSACKTIPLTGMAVTDKSDENVTNTTEKAVKFTVPDADKLKDEGNKTKTCMSQINELKEAKIQDEYQIGEVNKEKQKLAMEIQFKKDNKKYEKEVEEALEKLKELGKQSNKLKDDIESKKKAIRLLEEKCNLKS